MYMPIYSLYLNNLDTNGIYSPDYTISSWIVDFDSLFRRENYKYSKCKLRYKMSSRVNNVPTFETSLSYLGCSLSTNYNATNLLQPTILNTFVLVNSPITATRKTNSEFVNTAENVGTSINIPYGIQRVTISAGDITNFSKTTDFGGTSLNFFYHIYLQFELYN